MTTVGVIIALAGLWIISQSRSDGKLGPAAFIIGSAMVLVGVLR